MVLLDGRNQHSNMGRLGFCFYKQYQYNANLASTRVELQNMSICSNEGFKEYAQKWRDLAERVKLPLIDRELVDNFIGTLTCPLFNFLIGSSSSGFTELILTDEQVESGIKSGKIQMAASSSTVKKLFIGKKETNVVYGQRICVKNDRHQSIGVVLISNLTPVQRP